MVSAIWTSDLMVDIEYLTCHLASYKNCGASYFFFSVTRPETKSLAIEAFLDRGWVLWVCIRKLFMLKSNYSVSTSIFKSFNATFIHVIVNFPHLLECQAKIETPFFTTSSLDSRCTPLYILLVVWYNSWACSRFVPHPYLVLLSSFIIFILNCSHCASSSAPRLLK